MELLLLGTGSADGWPNPFCTCASCRAAAEQGVLRGQSAALVDGTVLLDCGPEVPRAAVRAGAGLAGVRHLLLTHAHPDHVGPAALLMRHWAGRAEPLEVIGPPSGLALCRDWVGPDDPVTFVPVAAGDVLTLDSDRGSYRLRVHAAAHGAEFGDGGHAVLYDLAGAGARIFWATDTGPLPESTVAAVAGADFDAVLLEQTFGPYTAHGTEHLDYATFAQELAGLRRRGAVTDHTDVVAVHLGHHNPPPDELDAVLAGWGARAGRDGERIILGCSPSRDNDEPTVPPRTLVLGGVRSGKSRHAERLLAACPEVTYLATGAAQDDDPDWQQRLAAHRARRPGHWRTVETDDIATELAAAGAPVLLDCVGTWLGARMDRHGVWDRDVHDTGALDPVHRDIDELVAAFRATTMRVVVVSNEVGSGIVPESRSGRLFRDLLGTVNARLAAEADEAVLMVAGMPTALRGGATARRSRWVGERGRPPMCGD